MSKSFKKEKNIEKINNKLKEKNFVMRSKNSKINKQENVSDILPFSLKNENNDQVIIFEEMRNSSKILEQILRKLEKVFEELNRIHWEEENRIEYQRGEKPSKNVAKTKKIKIEFKIKPKSGRKLVFIFSDQKEKKIKVFKKTQENFPVFLNNELDRIKKKIRTSDIVFYREFVEEVENMVNKIFSKYYFFDKSYFFNSYHSIMTEKIIQYKSKKLLDIDFLLTNWQDFKQKITKFPQYPLQPRLFNEIDNYKSVLEDTSDNKNGIYNLKQMLKSDLKPNCNQKCSCCNKNIKIENFSKSSILESTWKSSCKDKNNRIECDSNCNCHSNCKNRELQLINKKSPKDNIFMQIVWGIDFYTRKNLVFLLPDKYSVYQKDLIVNKIVKNLNFVGIEGWDISKSLMFLIHQCELIIKKKVKEEIKVAKISKTKIIEKDLNFDVEKIYKSKKKCYDDHLTHEKITIEEELNCYKILFNNSRIKQLRQAMRVHSKGLGVICKNDEGIKKNSLITEYLGEIYPTWYWSLKQDMIRNFLSKVKKNGYKQFNEYKTNYHVDFYNIMVEKQTNEENGREIFFVDPIINGNYASRLSHSCNPNCWAIPVISNGQYCIGMYAIRDIGYREELTFDYCSFTESEKEYKNSICLCGDYLCKAYYLSYTKKHNSFFDEKIKKKLIDYKGLIFIRNNVILLESCLSVFDDSKNSFLKEHAFGDNTFKNSPLWLKNWTYFTLKDIIEENQYLKKVLLKNTIVHDENQNVIKFEIENLYFQRINNLIISLDKIRHFCTKQHKTKYNSPPLKKISIEMQIKYYDDILKEILNFQDILNDKNMTNLIKAVQNKNLPENFKTILKDLPTGLKKDLVYYKLLFLNLSDFFLKKNLVPKYQSLSDILYFMSLTILQFTCEDYKEFEVNFKIRQCDLTNPLKNLERNDKSKKEQLKELEKTIIELPKKMISCYVWGQLVFWCKQSIDLPETSLIASKKGTLSYPNISSSFFISEKKVSKNLHKTFPFKSREKWLKSLKDKSIDLWSKSNNWSYDNKNQVYGTFLFDHFFLKTNFKRDIIKNISLNKDKRTKFFADFWLRFYKDL